MYAKPLSWPGEALGLLELKTPFVHTFVPPSERPQTQQIIVKTLLLGSGPSRTVLRATARPYLSDSPRRELNGTRLVVHAGNCWRVFRLLLGNSSVWGAQFFRKFLLVFAVFRFFLHVPLIAYQQATSQAPYPALCGFWVSQPFPPACALEVRYPLGKGASQRYMCVTT